MFKSVVINSVEDYIKAAEGVTEPVVKVTNLKPESYGDIEGTYYELSLMETRSSLVFMKGIYLYEISWPTTYSGIYKKEIASILSTFKFLDNNQISTKSEIAQICEEILKLPSNPNAGITFEESYCGGGQCFSARTKSACQSMDIIKVDNGKITSGSDGKVDCKWTENLGFYSCNVNY